MVNVRRQQDTVNRFLSFLLNIFKISIENNSYFNVREWVFEVDVLVNVTTVDAHPQNFTDGLSCSRRTSPQLY